MAKVVSVNISEKKGTVKTPVTEIRLPEICEQTVGALIYFFEDACGVSGYISGVNPFNQPGVEAYKKNMFHLLGKPGY